MSAPTVIKLPPVLLRTDTTTSNFVPLTNWFAAADVGLANVTFSDREQTMDGSWEERPWEPLADRDPVDPEAA